MNLNYVLCLKADALELSEQRYKTEMITNLEDGGTFCDHDTFTDLCRGGHIPNTGIIKAVKSQVLLELTGVAMKKQTTVCLWNFIPKQKI
jgi:threonyl-tRNA synthetase